MDWPRDHESLALLDISFETDAVYALVAGPLSFALSERRVDPPFRKRYDVSWEKLPAATLAVVAEEDGLLLGVAAITLREWNRSAVLSDLYVDRSARRRGVGTGLLQEVRNRAATLGARCLWVETQNVNAPALRARHGALRPTSSWRRASSLLHPRARGHRRGRPIAKSLRTVRTQRGA